MIQLNLIHTKNIFSICKYSIKQTDWSVSYHNFIQISGKLQPYGKETVKHDFYNCTPKTANKITVFNIERVPIGWFSTHIQKLYDHNAWY